MWKSKPQNQYRLILFYNIEIKWWWWQWQWCKSFEIPIQHHPARARAVITHKDHTDKKRWGRWQSHSPTITRPGVIILWLQLSAACYPRMWLRCCCCKYEKSVIRKSTRICPFNAKNRPDYSTTSGRLLERKIGNTVSNKNCQNKANTPNLKWSCWSKYCLVCHKRYKNMRIFEHKNPKIKLQKYKIWMREPLSRLVECPSWRPAATPKSLCCENKGRVEFASPPLILILIKRNTEIQKYNYKKT